MDFKATSGGVVQDRAFLIFDGDLASASIVSSDFTVTANFGEGTFDVAALETAGDGLTLTWGNTANNNYVAPFGTIQSNSPIPEPRLWSLISVTGIACLLLLRGRCPKV